MVVPAVGMFRKFFAKMAHPFIHVVMRRIKAILRLKEQITSGGLFSFLKRISVLIFIKLFLLAKPHLLTEALIQKINAMCVTFIEVII